MNKKLFGLPEKIDERSLTECRIGFLELPNGLVLEKDGFVILGDNSRFMIHAFYEADLGKNIFVVYGISVERGKLEYHYTDEIIATASDRFDEAQYMANVAFNRD
ncbi:MAG: hypothetical protein UT34_C0001G0414 [candidate division WS6 bacterium GW2011_GWF2_39_15]|uniref:Uncharacterized protein n=1 Tax=candidate division WS6 bacterium GW2011_GWF2_39_15 TaxID=1619100 RepID=A0A0G0MQR7_9BACT|nr:MAG: hypothetical protein UT34_C0001G0414 [candidate division WS6 bacterium GW2011_GWF2_39_15]